MNMGKKTPSTNDETQEGNSKKGSPGTLDEPRKQSGEKENVPVGGNTVGGNTEEKTADQTGQPSPNP